MGYGSDSFLSQPSESDQYYSSFSDSPRGGGELGYGPGEPQHECHCDVINVTSSRHVILY